MLPGVATPCPAAPPIPNEKSVCAMAPPVGARSARATFLVRSRSAVTPRSVVPRPGWRSEPHTRSQRDANGERGTERRASGCRALAAQEVRRGGPLQEDVAALACLAGHSDRRRELETRARPR